MEISRRLTTFFKADHLVILQNREIKGERDGCRSPALPAMASSGTHLLCRRWPPLTSAALGVLACNCLRGSPKLLARLDAPPEPRRRLLLRPSTMAVAARVAMRSPSPSSSAHAGTRAR